jgi:hypothetical protein
VPGVTTELAELVATMVSADPDRRPSLVALRNVLKRVRPSLQQVAAQPEPPPPVRAVGTEQSLATMSPSMVGARPVLQTPPSGTATLSQPNADPDEPPLIRTGPRPISPSQPHQAAGLRAGSSPVESTRLGVAVPVVRPSAPHPIRQGVRGSVDHPPQAARKTWLIVSFVVLVVSAIALVLVLAT